MCRQDSIPTSARHSPLLRLPSPPNLFGGEGFGVRVEIGRPKKRGIRQQAIGC